MSGVNSSMYIGVSGLNSFGTALSVVSDNVANANTTGFKGSSARFGDLVSSFYSTQSQDTDREGSGSSIIGVETNFGEGPMINTNAWSDLAVNGSGFFNVLTSNGQTLYTRDGSFHVDDAGYLVTNQGYQVLGSDGSAIQVETDPTNPQFSNFYVDANGQIYGTPISTASGLTNPTAIGVPLRITTFPNQDGLIRYGGNLYTTGPEAGAAVNGTAGSGPAGQIMDYTVEGSNVDLASEMVNMIIYQADYNANSKSISTGSQMLDTVVNLVR